MIKGRMDELIKQRLQKLADGLKQKGSEKMDEIKQMMGQGLTRQEINQLLEEKYLAMGMDLPLFHIDSSVNTEPESDPPVDTKSEGGSIICLGDSDSEPEPEPVSAEAAMSGVTVKCPCEGCHLNSSDPDPFPDDPDEHRREKKRRSGLHNRHRNSVARGSPQDPGPLKYPRGRAPRRKRNLPVEGNPSPLAKKITR